MKKHITVKQSKSCYQAYMSEKFWESGIRNIFSFLILTGVALFAMSCNNDDDNARPPLALTEFKPDRGPEGSFVLINGTGFSENTTENSVTINGVNANIIKATGDQLLITVPSGAATGKFNVSVAGGQAMPFVTDFTVVPPAEVAAFAGSDKGYSDGVGTSALFVEMYGIITDAQGNIYVSESATHRIRKITPDGVVTTFAGQGIQGYQDGPGAQALFIKPTGLATDASGNLYLAEYGAHRIRKITPDGTVSTLAGSGLAGGADGSAVDAQFNYPRCITADAQGNVYVGETYRIRKITPDGSVSTLAGGTQGYVDATGAEAKFDSIADLTIDTQGFLYAADYFNNMIRKISPAGEVTTVAGNGATGSDDGLAAEASFDGPTGVAYHSDGSILVADSRGRRIRKVVPGIVVNTIAGNGSSGFGDGTAGNVTFNKPNAIAVDSQNNIYVADNYRVRKITAQ